MSPVSKSPSHIRSGRLAATAVATCLAWGWLASPSLAFNIEVVNSSGRPSQEIFLTLQKGSSSDGQLPEDVPTPLSQIRSSTFTMGHIEGGRLYVSYGQGYRFTEPEQAPVRYDKIEFSGPQAGGVANLTAVDFFAIPFDLQALDSGGAQIGNALTYRCYTSTVLERLRALAPSAEVTGPSGEFLRFRSPQHTPPSYPSMRPYAESMTGHQIEVNDVYGKPETPASTLHYKGTFSADGSIKLTGTIAPPGGAPEEAGADVEIPGSTLPEAIYNGNEPFTVGGHSANVGENNEYSVIYRDVVAGFALGYWGGIYGNNAERSASGWIGKPDFAAARRPGESLVPAYDQYGAIIGEYSGAYGYAFHDLGPTPVTVPLESPEQTLRLTIDPDQGPSTPGCNGESTPAPRPGASTPGATPPGSSHGAAPAGTVKVHIDTSNAMLDKRGRALLALSCSGDPCRGELTLSARTLSRGRGRRGPRHARRAARHRGGTPRRAADQLIGHVEVAIGEGRTQRVWVTIDKAGRSAIARARGHRLAVLARVLVGPRSNPTTAGQRHIELRSFRARRHQRRRRRRHGRAHRP